MASSYNVSQSIRWLSLQENFNINNLDLYGQTLEDESQLQRPLGFIKFFRNVDECVDYITDVQDSYVVLTISGRLARHVIPHIHDFSQLGAVYIHCKPENKQRNKEWSKIYSKVKAVVSEAEEYIRAINRNHMVQRSQEQNPAFQNSTNLTISSRVRFCSTTPFHVFDSTKNTFKDLSTENGDFLWMQLLIEVLLHLDSSKSPIDELYQICDQFIERDTKDWESVLAFVGVHDSFDPIKWYTKEAFVYRFLNEILRSGDIDKIILLRMLVRDINNQLKEEHRKFVEPHITVYRGQAMKLTELEYLQEHIGHFISMNSFLSTSRDRDTALMFAVAIDTNDISLKSVLFEINCDTRRPDTKPFADISHLSCIKDEKEILFMLGSVFRVQNVHANETNQLWIVEMSLCGKNDYDSGDLFQSRRNNTDGYPTFTTLGLLFQDMGDFKRATQCFQQHLNVSEVGDTILRSACYHNLGNIAGKNGDYNKALEYLHESMTIRLSLPSIEKSIMGSLYNDLGVVYGETKDFKTALEYYEKALSYVLESVGENPNQYAMIYTNIGDSYRHLDEYDLALMNFNKSLEILTNLRLENTPEFAQTLGNIGTIYSLKNDYRTALLHMTKALDIERKILPNNHVNLATSYNNIALAYAGAEKFDLALENLKNAQGIFQAALPTDHPTTQDVAKNIELVKTIIQLKCI